MNNVIFLNGSPKKRKSVSEKLTRVLRKHMKGIGEPETIYLYGDDFDEEIFDKIFFADKVIIALPLYIDCLPAGVLEFFENCIKYKKENDVNSPEFYFIINCGFMEDRQNDTAIKILEKFSEKAGFCFKGGLSVGAGAMILNQENEAKLNRVMEALVESICEDDFSGSEKNKNDGAEINMDSEGDDSFRIFRINIEIPRFLFKAKSDRVWVDAAARRGLKKKDLKQKYYK